MLPCQCLQCGHALPPRLEEAQTYGTRRRHQVTELPPIQAHIIEYQCHGVICPECGRSTKAAIPEEANGQFGPELTALIVHLTVVCRMPRRVVERLLEQALGIEISLGSAQKCWEEASQAVAGPCQELEELTAANTRLGRLRRDDVGALHFVPRGRPVFSVGNSI